MFGFTKLTEEEKIEHERRKRISALEHLLHKESDIREESIARSKIYREELEKLLEGK
jgi:hypothetical protein